MRYQRLWRAVQQLERERQRMLEQRTVLQLAQLPLLQRHQCVRVRSSLPPARHTLPHIASGRSLLWRLP